MNLKEYFSHDLVASLVVFLVALPLCLGIALASGAPLQAGLIAGVIGGIVVGWISGSPLSVTGPAAGLATIVMGAIAKLHSFEAFLFAVVLAGAFQFILGLARAGFIGHFFPAAVIKGMLAAIGLILILKQIPHAVGYDRDYEGDESFFQDDGGNTFTALVDSLGAFSGGAALVALTTILILVFWSKSVATKTSWISLIPGPLVAVAIGIGLTQLFATAIPALAIAPQHMVQLPNFLASAGSMITSPDFNQWKNPDVYVVAATIGIVASLESLLSIEACDKLDPMRRITPLNRELKAQGVGNMLSGLLGGLPVTSVIVRSSANISAGANSKASSITHGIILLLSILFASNFLQMIPLSCLAGILIMVGYKLTPPSLYRDMRSRGPSQFLPFIITVAAIVFTNLLVGVFIGILVSIFFILKTNFKESVIMVGDGKNFLMKLTKDVSFLNKSTIRSKFQQVPTDGTLLIDGSEAHFVDQDIKEAIRDFIESAKAKKINVELKHLVI